MRTVMVKLPEPLFQALSLSAEVRRVSKSGIIREAPTPSLFWRIEDLVFDDARSKPSP